MALDDSIQLKRLFEAKAGLRPNCIENFVADLSGNGKDFWRCHFATLDGLMESGDIIDL